ncbi:MAG: FtsB family cell division protein [Anaerolineales bacterium]
MWWRAKSIGQRFLIVIGLAVLLLILFGFSRRIAEFTRLNAQLEREAARLTQLAATQAYLEDQIAYATSEAAVEEWAREEARWAKDGDFPIIPLVPPGYEPTQSSQPAGFVASASNWELWLSWLFPRKP